MVPPAQTAGEFDLIRRHFAPLAAHPGALGLRDDAALLRVSPGDELVLTADAQVAGRHFVGDEDPADIAAKLLRTNLSDLAAMGARPLGYLLTTAWTRETGEDWIAAFAAGLGADQNRFGLSLLGGDTVGTDGPLTLSLTALGAVPAGQALRRDGGRPGDRVYVSGAIGDARLGLDLARGTPGRLADLPPPQREELLRRYRRPEPRLALGQALRGHARAAIDVSDGLIADLGHVAEASGLAIALEVEAVPLSDAAAQAVSSGIDPLVLLSGGDDYELAFLAGEEAEDAILQAAAASGTPVARIGVCHAGEGVTLTRDGAAVGLPETGGYRHF